MKKRLLYGVIYLVILFTFYANLSLAQDTATAGVKSQSENTQEQLSFDNEDIRKAFLADNLSEEDKKADPNSLKEQKWLEYRAFDELGADGSPLTKDSNAKARQARDEEGNLIFMIGYKEKNITASFPFKNNSDKPVKLLKIKPGCSCTGSWATIVEKKDGNVVSSRKINEGHVIEPGQEGRIYARYKIHPSPRGKQKIVKPISIHTNAADNDTQHRLILRMEVPEFYRLEKSFLSWTPEDLAVTKSAELIFDENIALDVDHVVVAKDSKLSVAVEEIDKKKFRIDVTPKKDKITEYQDRANARPSIFETLKIITRSDDKTLQDDDRLKEIFLRANIRLPMKKSELGEQKNVIPTKSNLQNGNEILEQTSSMAPSPMPPSPPNSAAATEARVISSSKTEEKTLAPPPVN